MSREIEANATALAARFPPGFLFGTATASYQIEGSVAEDGRGESVWDRFSHTPGKTFHGGTGDVACDHYHRYRQDVGLMATLGLNAYRFSIAWPRILPGGRGPVNQKGLDFYRRLVEELRVHGIEPWATLYHWDLPQALEDRGGWLHRDTAEAFAEYAAATVDALGDVCSNWITLNEPAVQAWMGYGDGQHAPGRQEGDAGAVRSSHYQLLGHGLAISAIRARSESARAGITLNLSPAYPATTSGEDEIAAAVFEAGKNRWYLDPVLLGGYPEDAHGLEQHLPAGWEADLTKICRPLDFLGVNYYNRTVVEAGRDGPNPVAPDGVPRTDNGWEIFPEGLRVLLLRLNADYDTPAIYITENGAAYADEPGEDGRVRDERRVDFLHRHLNAIASAIEGGCRVRGYFLWSLMDNFEWACAYDDRTRFGIVYTDYKTQERIVKDSGLWYASVIAAGGRVPTMD